MQGDVFEVDRATVANGDSCVFLQEHQSHGFTNNIAATDHDSVFALEGIANALKHLHAAKWGTWPEAFHARHQSASAGDMKSVYIFSGADGLDDFLCIDMGRQRKLDQDAVDRSIVIECVDTLQQIGFTQCCVVFFEHGVKSSFFTRFNFVTHIHLTGGVLADQYNGESRFHTLGSELCCIYGDLRA